MNVHFIHKTHMEELDCIARKYFKLWLRIQKHGVSDAGIFHPYMLNIQTPSQLYKEAHASSYALIRTKGDVNVNHALDSRVVRESLWSRKYSTVCEADRLYRDNISRNIIIHPTSETNSQSNILVHKKRKP